MLSKYFDPRPWGSRVRWYVLRVLISSGAAENLFIFLFNCRKCYRHVNNMAEQIVLGHVVKTWNYCYVLLWYLFTSDTVEISPPLLSLCSKAHEWKYYFLENTIIHFDLWVTWMNSCSLFQCLYTGHPIVLVFCSRAIGHSCKQYKF